MSFLQEERRIILSNEYVESFDFAEVENFVKNANKELFIQCTELKPCYPL